MIHVFNKKNQQERNLKYTLGRDITESHDDCDKRPAIKDLSGPLSYYVS